MAIANGTCVSFCTFWPPLGTPLRQSRYVTWVERGLLVKRIAAYTHLFSTVYIRAIARYWSEIATFPIPVVFNAPVRGVPIGITGKVWSSEN